MNYPTYLRIVVRPDFFAAVCARDKAATRVTPVDDVLHHFAVHETGAKDLECTSTILFVSRLLKI